MPGYGRIEQVMLSSMDHFQKEQLDDQTNASDDPSTSSSDARSEGSTSRSTEQVKKKNRRNVHVVDQRDAPVRKKKQFHPYHAGLD